VTFKRIMLIVLPFLGAVFIFMVLHLVYSDWEASFMASRPPLPGGVAPPIPTGKQGMKVQTVVHEVSTNVNLVRKDREGRDEVAFHADRIDHPSGNTADIDRPGIKFFTKAGETITLLADKARLITKGAVTNLANIESGVMWGNVVLIHDRGTPDDPTDDLYGDLDNLTFNGDMSELATDGPVALVGADMMLTARKMRVAIDRKTRRISTMTFMEDIRVTLVTTDRVRIGLTGPAETAPAAPGSEKVSGTFPESRRVPDTFSDPAAEQGPPAAAAARGPEVWRIDLAGNVDARQGDQRLQSDRLSLHNRPGRAAGQAATPVQAGAAGAPTRAERPRSADSPRRRGEGPMARLLAPDAPPPIVVVADGPLIITPLSPEEQHRLGDLAYQVAATGSPVVIDDTQTHIVGAEVQYNLRTGAGSVIGKESPVLLEQPGRLRLTGWRLDFDRSTMRPGHPYPTADVQGEGQLYAEAQGMSLSGRTKPPAAEGPPVPPSPLEARWMRAMHLEFYQLPTDPQAGPGEIRRATFSGQAVVSQKEGVLKGDELAIDFSKSEPGRGQSVEHLVGHGNVFIKNQPPEGGPPPQPDAAKAAPRMALGDIACQDLDLTFARDAAGDTQPKRLKATGKVEINDTGGKIQADELTVTFGPSAKGGVEPQFFEAFGKVFVNREDLRAEGDHVRRDMAAGTLLLEGKPAMAARGRSRVVGRRIEFSQAEGTASVRGAGELEMPATTDLRGRQRKEAEPLIVTWRNSMLFEDKRNFAQFDGAVTAATGASRLASDRLWVYFADRPADAAAEKVSGTFLESRRVPDTFSDAPPAGRAKAPSKPTAGSSKTGGEVDQLFGRKGLVRVLAEKNVHAVEQQWNPDKSLRYTMETIGDNLTYVDESRKVYIRGPGRMRLLSRERPKAGEAETAGLGPDALAGIWAGAVPAGYSRTEVGWVDSMAYDGAADRAYFKGDVDAVYSGRGAPGGAGAAGAPSSTTRRRVTTTRIQSSDLQIIFAEKAPAAAAGSEKVSGTLSRRVPDTFSDPAGPPAVPREERMAVEKLAADGGVLLWVDDRRGTAERLIYQRDPELIRLYRGTEDWARLWQENEATQEFGEIVARIITFEPATGLIEVVDQQSLTVSPRPKPAAPAKAGPRPMFQP
jgi:lipopolysaccharide export system protein LptA/lipopolysaccharide export system protein LptC